MLKPEFVDLLQLDVLGFDNPEDALHAFSNAQNELCQPGFSPNETVESNTFIDCNIVAANCTVLSFTNAALYLVFARLN